MIAPRRRNPFLRDTATPVPPAAVRPMYDDVPADVSSVQDCFVALYNPKRTAPLICVIGPYVHLRQVTITDAGTPVELILLGARILARDTRGRVRRAYRKALRLHIERRTS